MSLIKYPLTLFLCFLGLLVFSQARDSTVFMKWKLKPNEVLFYKTIMQEIDTANHKDLSFDGMIKAMGINKDHSFDEVRNKLTKLNEEIQNANFITHLTEKKKGVINLEMSLIRDSIKTKKIATTNDKYKETLEMMNQMMTGVMLRGAIYEDGTIESFYTKPEQKNLMAILFELPGKPVKVGDTWSLSISLLSMDQNFVCDSSYRKNQVTLISIENKGGEHIVNLGYDVSEYISGSFLKTKTSMKMMYQGVAGFSLEKGRWVMYDGIMSISSIGIMSSQSTKKISLIIQ